MSNRRTPRGPRIKVINIVSVVLTLLIVLLFLLGTQRAYQANRDLNEATEKYVACEMAATVLKQGSDNLTTQVRLYTITGDPAYLRAYFAEVASHHREQAVDTLERYLSDTEAYRFLEDALECSIELMDLEYYAMALVLDATGGQVEPGMEALWNVRLRSEDKALDASGKMALAVSLMHGEGYLRYDAVIDDNVAQCIENVRLERETIHLESQKTLTRMQARQTLSAGVLAVVILAYVVLTMAYMIRPIGADVQLIAGDQPLPLKGAYELQYLANAYNAMYEQRRERDTLAAERARALELLKREQTSLNILHEMLHSGMWTMDFNERGEMTDVFWSDEFRRMLGYESEEDFPNVLESWSDLLPESDRERVLKEYNDTISDYTGQKTYDVEYQLLTKDRGWRWFHAVGRPSRREDGSPVTYVGLFVDITDRKKMQCELDEQRVRLEDALKQAQSANHAKTAFLMNMSHDIRTPMNAIIGFTTLANDRVEDAEAVRDYLQKISVSSDHLLSLINNVLEMSRIESGQIELCDRECSLEDILYDVRTIVQADIAAKDVKFLIDTADVVNGNLICDRARLSQVLLNVLSNALKFTPAGGTISVRIRQFESAEEGCAAYEFKVRDTGIGMSREFKEHLFEAFSRERTSTVSGLEGAGLGLAITKNIVDLMRGEIAVESEEGKGTEFTITLPLRLGADARQTEALPKPEKAPVEKLSFSGRKVLLVEDNEINQEIARMVLEKAGFEVDVADDGTVAVEKVRGALPGQYDLILMDIQMPIMNGYEATRRIRALDSPLAGIPIIALSANALEEDKRNSLESGMNNHVGKPFDVQQLLDLLRSYLK